MACIYRDLRDEFWRLLGIEDYDDWTQKQFADHLQCGLSTIKKWSRDAPWDQIKADRRKRYSDHTVKVDAALHKAAMKGDVAAMKLWYERFDAWVPEQKISLVENTDDELKTRGMELLSLLHDRPKSGDGRDSPGTGEARA